MRKWVGGLAVVGLLFGVGACQAHSGPIAGRAPAATLAPTPTRTCPPGTIPVHVFLPDRRQVSVNVYNGTSKVNLATTVAQELSSRGLVVRAVSAASGGPYPQTLMRFGPDGVGAAWELRAYFPDARSEFDAARKGAPVDVILGATFSNVPTATEINQAIAQLGQVVPPAGTCPVD
jgi:LytR cell envelope-related transcriptional attenuator